MFELLASDLLRFLHLLTVAVGFGVAVETEAFMLRRHKTTISPGLLSGLKHRHTVILYALGAMWVTGIALVALRTGFQIPEFSPKLWAKISVVTILTVNAFFVAEVALPILSDFAGKRISDLPQQARRALFAVAGISATSWLVALALGSSAALKVGPAWLFQSVLPMAYIVGILVANAVGQRIYAPAARTAAKSRSNNKPKSERPIAPRAAITASAAPRPSPEQAAKLDTPKQPDRLQGLAEKKPAPRLKKRAAPQTPQTEVRASDLAIAFPQKLKRKPRLKADPLHTDAQVEARKLLREVAADLQAR